MTSGQKIAFSLLIAIGLFSAFVLTLHSKVFKELETKFYTQSKIEENIGQLNKISESCESYISEILNQLEKSDSAWVKNQAIRSFYTQNPSEAMVSERRTLTEELFAKIPALTGIRIVDKNGKNVHYSSFDDTDLLKQSGITKVYKNYPDIQRDADEIEFASLEKLFSESQEKILFDETKNRLIITIPFFWMDEIYSGQCIFYLNMNSVQKALNRRGTLAIGQNITMYSDSNYDGGFVFDLPAGEKKTFKEAVLKYWKNNNNKNDLMQTPEKLLEMEDGNFWLILSSTNSSHIKISGIYTSSEFEISNDVKLLIYISIFITILLVIFLIFSFRRDPLLVLKKRIKKIQYGIIKECIDSEDKLEWNQVAKKLKNRRNDFTLEILKSLKVHNKKKKKELEEFLDQNWSEIFSVFDDKVAASSEKNGTATELTGASLEEIRKVLEEVLQNTKVNVASVESIKMPVQQVSEDLPEDAEEIEEIDDAEEIDEIEDAEDLDEVEEIEEAEEISDADDVEKIEEAKEISDAEEAEEIDDAEEVEEISDAEEVSESQEETEAEQTEEIEDAEEIDDAEEIEELSDADEEIEDAEEVIEDAEEVIDDVEEIEEETPAPEDTSELVEDPEDIETIDDVEELGDDDLEVLDEVLELDEEVDYDKPPKFHADAAIAMLLNQPEYIYRPTNETYFASENFATVDNIGAEELIIGAEISRFTLIPESGELFLVHQLPEMPEPEVEETVTKAEGTEPKSEKTVTSTEDTLDEVEELTDEVPESNLKEYYSMTNFADNLTLETPELEAASMPENAIVEVDGVFSISNNLDFKSVKQDMDFKALVDSVL